MDRVLAIAFLFGIVLSPCVFAQETQKMSAVIEGDQVTASVEQLHKFSEDSGVALFNYLKASLLDN